MSQLQKLTQKKIRLLRNFYVDLSKGLLIGSILAYLEMGSRVQNQIIIGTSLAFLFLNFALYLMGKE